MSYKVIIIEDEQALLQTLKLNLGLEGYITQACNSGLNAVELIIQFKPDLILLDIMLPMYSGTDILKTLRQQNIQTPVIFLTAKTDIQHKLEGLKLGADDYITKPFDLEELLLRIQNILKRNVKPAQEIPVFKFNTCEINFETFEVITKNGYAETLSKREIALLKLLVENLNKVVSRDEILDKLWTRDENPSSRTIDNYILNFRKLFEQNPKQPIHFLSIRSVGYKLTF